MKRLLYSHGISECILELQKTDCWQLLENKSNISKWQVQVGLIDSDGKTEVPRNRGFAVLEEIAAVMKRELGRNNILHIFGYSRGHDIGYPDYSPSEVLGGSEALRRAIRKIHDEKQKAVLYLNGRIAAVENVRNDGLGQAVLQDTNGRPIIETYHGREFFVMNPSSKAWQRKLLETAEMLKSYDADGIQLDQLGGREAMVSSGEVWGAGYIEIANAIQSIGLTVWIEGVIVDLANPSGEPFMYSSSYLEELTERMNEAV